MVCRVGIGTLVPAAMLLAAGRVVRRSGGGRAFVGTQFYVRAPG
jgi:hypothetical protein